MQQFWIPHPKLPVSSWKLVLFLYSLLMWNEAFYYTLRGFWVREWSQVVVVTTILHRLALGVSLTLIPLFTMLDFFATICYFLVGVTIYHSTRLALLLAWIALSLSNCPIPFLPFRWDSVVAVRMRKSDLPRTPFFATFAREREGREIKWW